MRRDIEEEMSSHRPASPPATLRVLTLNTHKGFAALGRRFVLNEMRDAVREVGADLIFLQEVQGSHVGNSASVAGWPEAPHYEFLADALWPEFAYGRNAVYPEGHHGNAVLSKYPIVAYENRDVSIDGHETRGLLHCTLRLPGHALDLHAICVHLGLKESHRRHQLALLSDIVRDHVPTAAPLIVAGDFNDWAKQAHRILEESAGLREVFVHSNGRSPKTFPAGFPLLSLDRIYVRNVRVHTPLRLPRQPWSRLSDHVPLAAEIGL